MKRLAIAILAHVDAGKTTLTEAMLLSSGTIRRAGRVDRGDAFLDNHAIERERGITVFSKQAILNYEGCEITLLDTPGHVDFACEAERVLSVPDAAILVLSAPDGVTAHTRTLWNLLASRHIPTVIFVNKTDIAGRNQIDVMREIRAELSPCAANFSLPEDKLDEEIASQNERLMEKFFGGEKIEKEEVAHEVAKRRLIPVWFGSALHGEGVGPFLSGLCRVVCPPGRGSLFGARVFKIARDPQGNRLTYLRVTGGKLNAKDSLHFVGQDGMEYDEKVEQIRIYSGEKFRVETSAEAGVVCAVLGLSHSFAGLGLGVECTAEELSLEPILTYRVELPAGVSPHDAYAKLSLLSEEDPTLALTYDEGVREIRVRLMGEIQREVLTRLARDRFGLSIGFAQGKILYKETIAAPVYGAGHFEPLRHYAEVHLFLEPLPAGSGLVFASECPVDLLSVNFQRLVLTHLEEKRHRGVLIGAPITDMKITLTAGRAHQKHTEGGDFRQATYRAVRQGLMKAETVLLEPYERYTLTVPSGVVGRAMTDLDTMGAGMTVTEQNDRFATLVGEAPAALIGPYAETVRAYTRGEGSLTLTYAGYRPCLNPERVMAENPYDPTLDERNTPDSVFCQNGSGFVVPWNEADAMMHLGDDGRDVRAGEGEPQRTVRSQNTGYRGTAAEDKELERIFEQTYGPVRRKSAPERRENAAPDVEKAEKQRPKKITRGEEYLLVDGYNIIFAWKTLAVAARDGLCYARDELIRILANYAGYKKTHVILVFDAYKVKDGQGSVERCGGIDVVYTKEKQTADAYIEKTSAEIAKIHTVRVATSDGVEQMIVLGNGALRVPAKELYEEIERANTEIRGLL